MAFVMLINRFWPLSINPLLNPPVLDKSKHLSIIFNIYIICHWNISWEAEGWKSYPTISLLSNIDKILEKLTHSRLIKFLTEQKSFIIKSLALRRIFPLPMLLWILLIVSKIYWTKANLCAVFLLTSRKLIMRSYGKAVSLWNKSKWLV